MWKPAVHKGFAASKVTEKIDIYEVNSLSPSCHVYALFTIGVIRIQPIALQSLFLRWG